MSDKVFIVPPYVQALAEIIERGDKVVITGGQRHSRTWARQIAMARDATPSKIVLCSAGAGVISRSEGHRNFTLEIVEYDDLGSDGA